MHLLMKTGPYDPQLPEISKYQSIAELLVYKNNPALDIVKMEKLVPELNPGQLANLNKISQVYCSDLLRTRETLEYLLVKKFLKNVNTNFIPALREIEFDAKKLFSEAEYMEQGSTIVRERFIEAFIADKLNESRAEIKERFVELDKLFLEKKEDNILTISHTFFIKLYLIYLQESRLFAEPEIIKKHIDPQKRIMEFCSIFEIGQEKARYSI